jgi:hypothetical protein
VKTNAHDPPKEKRGLGAALKTAELITAYRLLGLLQAPFSVVFWLIEQRKGQLQDQLENERSAPL